MRIAIIGAGSVGRALGGGWARQGHEISFGVRSPADPKYGDLPPGTRVAGVGEAAAEAEVVVLATPWDGTRDAIDRCGDLAGRVVVDCTNPLEPDLSGLTLGHDDSAGEQVARWAPGAKVVKAFNSVGSNIMENPRVGGQRAVMFIAGDDEGKATVRRLSEALGFDTVDAGGIDKARLLEPLAMLWISLAYQQGMGREWALTLVRAAGP